MSNQKRNLAIFLITFVLLIGGGIIYFLLFQPNRTRHSLLLYTSYPSKETTANWIVNMDTGKKWEVGNNMEAGHWSPLGKHISFYTYIRKVSITTIWVSDPVGKNLRQVFDGGNYPDLKITGYDWLTDEIILVNVVSKTENSGFVYALNVNTLAFQRLNQGNFLRVSPNGNFWLHYITQYYLMDLGKNTTPITLALTSELYAFSPDGNQWAYFCDRKENSSSLCLADLNINGITNEHKIADVETPVVTLDIWWSQDGKYIGIQTYNRSTNETRFRAIDVSNGSIVYDWAFPTKTSRNFWSPRGDKIIDFDGVLLDLKTGEISNFFQNEPIPSYIVDWRMIEVR